MSAEKHVAAYGEALALTERMLAAARDNQWEELVRLEQARDHLIEDLRLHDVEPPRDPDLRRRKRDLLQSILTLDQEVRTLTDDWMHELREILESARNVDKLGKTYDPGR